MTQLTFRRATSEDLPGIVAMLADDELGRQREDAAQPLNLRYQQAFDAIERDGNQFLAVSEFEGQLAGCLQLTFIPGLSRRGMWRGQIESVRIAAEFRDQGFGRTMFEWAIDECRERGCELVQLTTDKTREDAARFYASLGFEASHDGLKLAL